MSNADIIERARIAGEEREVKLQAAIAEYKANPDKPAFTKAWIEVASAAMHEGGNHRRRIRIQVAGGELTIAAQTWGHDVSVYTSFIGRGRYGEKMMHSVEAKNPTDIEAEADTAFDAWLAAI